MPRNLEKLLYQIVDSGSFAQDSARDMTIEDLRKDRARRSAILYELQIVGEALGALEKLSPEIAAQISEHKRIIRFRHVVVHGYDSVDIDLVWTIIQDKLPRLIDEARLLYERKLGG